MKSERWPMRNCKLRAACCGKLFTCRFCHDNVSDHSMDRKATSEMMCMHCLTIQVVGPIPLHVMDFRWQNTIATYVNFLMMKDFLQVGGFAIVLSFHCQKSSLKAADPSSDYAF